MWDSTTLSTEKSRSRDMAQVILGPPPKPEDLTQYRERITRLTANRKEDDPMWWNDLAVAHMRLGQLSNAVELLEPAVKKFPSDYGVHANLGTAYHLMGRYADAEREIARDLEINTNAHFGLEKYHLALLQYLVRDAKYQSRHLYVDELTAEFFKSGEFLRHYDHGPLAESDRTNPVATPSAISVAPETNVKLAQMEEKYQGMPKVDSNFFERGELLADISAEDVPPPYAAKWNLAEDPKLKEGVLYMASLNPKEPACFEMLGVVSLMNRDRHLAVAAFEKAITLGSPQKSELQVHVDLLNDFMQRSRANNGEFKTVLVVGLLVVVAIVALILFIIKKLFFRRSPVANVGRTSV